MTRSAILLALLSLSSLSSAVYASDLVDAQPQILAKVTAREFLYNHALTYSGTLGVDQVRYELEVVDAWHVDAELAKGTIVTVTTPGGCEGLMNTDGRYLVPIHAASATLTSANSPAVAPPNVASTVSTNQWQSGCAVATEAAAKDTIAKLNQSRVTSQSVLHLSAN